MLAPLKRIGFNARQFYFFLIDVFNRVSWSGGDIAKSGWKSISHGFFSPNKLELSKFAIFFDILPCSNNKSLRYVKQINVRATEVKYDSQNVLLCEIVMDYNRLQFQFRDFADERVHHRVQSHSKSLNMVTPRICLTAR